MGQESKEYLHSFGYQACSSFGTIFEEWSTVYSKTRVSRYVYLSKCRSSQVAGSRKKVWLLGTSEPTPYPHTSRMRTVPGILDGCPIVGPSRV